MNHPLLSLTAPGAQLCACLLKQGLRVRVRVSGTSMAPLLSTGDVVHLAPAGPGDLSRGDILFIQDSRRGFYLHRLLRRPRIGGQTMLQTRGDSHWRLDDPVSSDQVLARVTDIEHRPGKPRHWRWWAETGRALAWLGLLQSAGYYLLKRLRRRVFPDGCSLAPMPLRVRNVRTR